MKIKILILNIILSLFTYGYSQNFEIDGFVNYNYRVMDSLTLGNNKLFVYIKNNKPDNSKERIKADLEYLNSNFELIQKYRNAGDFSNFSGNATISIVASSINDKTKYVACFVYCSNNKRCILYGEIVLLNKSPYLLCLKSTFTSFSLAIIKINQNKTYGTHPEFLDTIDLEHNPWPSKVHSEMKVLEKGYIDRLKTITFSNSLLIHFYKKRVRGLNQADIHEDIIFDFKTNKWSKAIQKTKILATDSTYYLSKTTLKLPEIEKSDKLIEKISRIGKQFLNIKCEINEIQSFRINDSTRVLVGEGRDSRWEYERKNEFIFIVRHKKRCKPVFVKYDAIEKKWYKVEWGKMEIVPKKYK